MCSAPVTGFFHVYDVHKIKGGATSYSNSRQRERAHHGQHFDIIFRPRGQLVHRDLLPLALHREPRAVRTGRPHPLERMRRIAHSGAHRDAPQFAAREDLERRPARDERGRGERDGQRVARPVVVVVPARLLRALRHADRVERRRFGRGERVERGVHVPAVEARRACCLVGGGEGRLVEGGVGGVLEHCGLEALVVVHGAVADELHLGHARDGLDVRV